MTSIPCEPTPSEIAQAKEAEERLKRQRFAQWDASWANMLPLPMPEYWFQNVEHSSGGTTLPPAPPEIYVPVSEWFWEMYLREADEAQNAAPVKS